MNNIIRGEKERTKYFGKITCCLDRYYFLDLTTKQVAFNAQSHRRGIESSQRKSRLSGH